MLALKKSIAEGIGTFLIVFVGCGTIIVADRFPGSLSTSVIPIVFGLIVAAMIYSIGHISGAHFNPAVTLAFSISRHFPTREVIFYWAGQFLGALIAICLLHLILPPGSTYGATIPSISIPQALCWEIVLTFCLMFVIISVATDSRAEGTMAGTAIGAAVTVCAFVGGPITGASMNPARSLAPAIFQHTWGDLWIYFVGPFTGAMLAAFAYQMIRCKVEPVGDPAGDKTAKGCC